MRSCATSGSTPWACGRSVGPRIPVTLSITPKSDLVQRILEINFIYKSDKLGDMEMRQLEYFVAVADELSFSRGAARVHVVQSAVSTAIAKLERELGIDLFDRSKLRITLTTPGATFLAEARATLAAAR